VSMRTYPRRFSCGGAEIEFRFMKPDDAGAVWSFARSLPAHDLLFLPRDITHEKVLAAWVEEIGRGALTSLLALHDGAVVGCSTIARDPLSWSPHVGELRILVAPGMRGKGLGRRLTQESFAVALGLGIEKMVAQMTTDQRGALAVFETMGFRPEALLREQVRDRNGSKHDLVVLSHDVARFHAQLEAYGLTEALLS
jgi:RimJ/RimL family protein N-acetyltransferase